MSQEGLSPLLPLVFPLCHKVSRGTFWSVLSACAVRGWRIPHTASKGLPNDEGNPSLFPHISSASVFSTSFIPTRSQTPPLMSLNRRAQRGNRLPWVNTNPHLSSPQTVHHSHQEPQTGAMSLPGWQGIPTTSRLCAVARGPNWKKNCRANYSFSEHLWGPQTYSGDFLLP